MFLERKKETPQMYLPEEFERKGLRNHSLYRMKDFRKQRRQDFLPVARQGDVCSDTLKTINCSHNEIQEKLTTVPI
jgi:hypothetical protein